MTLLTEARKDVIATGELHVQPNRDLRQWGRQVGGAEDQERDQHLSPCGAGLRRRTDDDVSVAEREALPPRAVRNHRSIPSQCHSRKLSGVRFWLHGTAVAHRERSTTGHNGGGPSRRA